MRGCPIQRRQASLRAPGRISAGNDARTDERIAPEDARTSALFFCATSPSSPSRTKSGPPDLEPGRDVAWDER